MCFKKTHIPLNITFLLEYIIVKLNKFCKHVQPQNQLILYTGFAFHLKLDMSTWILIIKLWAYQQENESPYKKYKITVHLN